MEELVNVRVDFLRLLLIDVVSNSFHDYDFLQRGNIFFEATIIMNVFFHSRKVVDQVQISRYELCGHFHLCPCPSCWQLPGSAFYMPRANQKNKTLLLKNLTDKTLSWMWKYDHILAQLCIYLRLEIIFLFQWRCIMTLFFFSLTDFKLTFSSSVEKKNFKLELVNFSKTSYKFYWLFKKR